MSLIKIAEKLSPFSHEIGTYFLLPQTHFVIQVFPTRFYLIDLENSNTSFWVSFDWSGPVREFTAQLDLERGGLSVFGKALQGYVRYEIALEGKSLYLKLDKAPKEGVCILSSLLGSCKMQKGEKLLLVESIVSYEKPLNKERLSLGNHKAQEFSSMKRRLDFKELFPHWLQLAKQLPPTRAVQKREGNYQLLDQCFSLVKEKRKLEILPALNAFFLSSFYGVFVPRLVDTEYQGFLHQDLPLSSLPTLPLLKESAECIRSLFYREEGEGMISLLPCLPPDFHCGRMMGIQSSTGAVINFEWTKKALRKVCIDSSCSSQLHLFLPKGISSCRLKRKRDNLEKIEVPKGGSIVLSLEPRGQVVLDRFEG